MDLCNHRIRLYAMQAVPVLQALDRDGRCFSKKEYVTAKYSESAPIFTTAYSWFVREFQGIVPKPEGAEYPYWAFADLYSLDVTGGGNVLKLQVPLEEAVLFDMYDWNRILCLKYLGKDKADEKEFENMLDRCGLQETKIMLTDFYPHWKRQIMASWSRLFRHHPQLKLGNQENVGAVQAGLWQIKKEWIV